MRFSRKQRIAMSWWCDASPWRDREAVVCDGAVRSGKTLCLGMGFFFWAMSRFDGEQFALCARSMEAVRRNLLHPLRPRLEALGFAVEERVSRNWLKVAFGGHENTFWLFGGKDEGSAGSIQGVTLAGAFLDEVTLMPRSFVEQTAARCSVEGAKLWFSCNPEGPEHWFYREWVCKAEEKKALRLHFLMTDNPSIGEETLERYKRYFQGMFYRRFVLGEWALAEGRVYDFFEEGMVEPVPQGEMEEWRISCDYGTVNPTSMGLWGRRGDTWYRVREYYYDSQRTGRQMTDREYVRELERLAGGHHIRRVVVDPSAASFIAALREEGWPAAAADNQVLSGIRVTADLLRRGRLVICEGCVDAIREFSLYCWDREAGEDRVVKRFDHAMDEIRYFAMSLRREAFIGGFGVERK
ncbi:MAG: PBSX family phage terminase large subunit [Oscillospiraceae bacterium]|jgi:PBSX family phage terminase large subunit|nr:PBSX family phage terminase large subunit [Oscillospiraceae bacterium]